MEARATRLAPPIEPGRDHVLGSDAAELTLVEYGSYVCAHCHVAHEVIRQLRDRFGDRLRYVFRHLPLADRGDAMRAAELAEYVASVTGEFWPVHDAIMRGGPRFDPGELDGIAASFGAPDHPDRDDPVFAAAAARVRADARSGIGSGARLTPTFFINGRRYEGAWDEAELSEALLRSLGHRLHAASVDFGRWGPSTGVLLLLMTGLALALSNSGLGPAFSAFWQTPFGWELGGREFVLPLGKWVNDGLLTIFFLVVGLEIKRELTVGRLASLRAAAFPLGAAVGGMLVPPLLFLALAPPEYRHAWGATMTTDTAFAIALVVLLGARVPVELRIFLTAVVIADDLVAIVVVALAYSGALSVPWLAAAGALALTLVGLNRAHVYRALPYAVVGAGLWFCLLHAGVHATLAGVLLALATPTREPPNFRALLAQAQALMVAEAEHAEDVVLRTGPSEPTLRALDAVHDRLESPASKLLRNVEPWSSYLVLPLFAFANAGVTLSGAVLPGRERLMLAIVLALVFGKLLGITAGALLAVRLGLAVKPHAYSWRQVSGAAALGGIGFTMSLFIAGQAFEGADFDAAKLAIFGASLLAGALGTAILAYRAASPESAPEGDAEVGTPVVTGERVPA